MIFEDSIRNMSDGDLAQFGVGNIAYIKPAQFDTIRCFVLTSAMGEEIVVTSNYQAALAAAYDRDLIAVSLN